MATRLSPTTFGYQNFFSATLSADITSGTLVIGLSTVPTPTAGILVIEPDSSTAREVILYTSKGASTVTAPSDGRGYSGSTAASHLQGSTVIMAPVDKWFTALASGELSTDPLRTELFANYVASGLVWSADAAGSTRNASMTSGVIYIQGRRLTLAAVTARSFTASRDTYIDVADSAGDGTGTITYTEVTNNAASPALTTNNVRIGVIVTGAGNIAASTSVNQGQGTALLPTGLRGGDSLGNSLCPRGGISASGIQNPAAFRVYRNAAQNTINGTTKILFDTKSFDKGANFDIVTNNRFTAPVTGIYNFSAIGQSVSTGNLQLSLYKNGSVIASGVNASGSGVNQGSIVTDTVQLVAGDYVEIFVGASTAVALFVGASGVYFSGYLVAAS